ELTSVNVLEQINASGGNVQRTAGQPTRFDLSMDSLGLLEVDLLNPTLITQFQADEFIGNIVDTGSATVTLEILPVTQERLPGLYDAVGGVTSTVTASTREIGSLLDELSNISPGILRVDGLTEATDGLDALNNLEDALSSFTAYTQEDVVVNYDSATGIITVEYADGIGQHLEAGINDVVIELLNNLADALNNLEITLLEGGINTSNILQ